MAALAADTASGAPAPAAAPATAPLPLTYKRLVAERCGASFREVARVVDTPIQLPGPGEVLIRISHAGINGGCETFRVRGEFAFSSNCEKEGFPLGAEGAGVVVALGEGVTSLQVGQAVTCNGAAAFSEFAVAKALMCTPVPAATPEAVALSLSAVTACCALEATAGVKAGDTVAVTAAAGGTGHFGVQLAKLAGAKVVAITGSPEKVGYISEYPHALAPGTPVSAGPDGVSLDALFWGGKATELEGGRRVIGQVWPSDPRAIRQCKRRVFDLHETGHLVAWADVSHGFKGVDQVADAIDYMLAGRHVGKVVIPIT
ncbi:hypothetical protein MNEG_4480 [Monoraphidium neglectum]|uniref:Enoyl reductase (ER) domain-containing protein n=1 Tax=Monoraphidium neglectum TaxID=145388 RepID=A0A0D2L9I5_9CHLO|nr:hypothetical protein MNEG_4480 [Monoraphidium neglectum]KIZ03484.1 hypothetical protein MNEG_4480 [Monoraphidium neglectum]|eukprot:XP_013902503.1 hypothetical protein MNEG_4480 [Monoraphidium neglectum]